jgi:transposase
MKTYRSVHTKPTSDQKKINNSCKKRAPGNLEKVNLHAAGIDVAATELWVCVPPEQVTDNVRRFGTFTRDLQAVAAWLKENQVTTVAMESTGVYWIVLYQHLEAAGFKVVLVNARQLKNVPGRTKTDKLDCCWIQKLHTFGLLQGSFLPTAEVRQLRAILRYRAELINRASMHVNHMHPALRQMNILLGDVISDINGMTGLAIIDAILNGERNPLILARLKHPHIRSSEAEIAQALTGDYRPEFLFILGQARACYRDTHDPDRSM